MASASSKVGGGSEKMEPLNCCVILRQIWLIIRQLRRRQQRRRRQESPIQQERGAEI